MDRRLIEEAREEARRFLRRCDELDRLGKTWACDDYRYCAGKLTAAVRRASLDLTRALTILRKGKR